MDHDSFDTLKAQYEHPQPKKAPNKTLRLVIITVIAIIVIAAIAAAVLLIVKPKTTSAPTVSSSQQTGGPKATDVIAQISANPTITAATNYWQYHINATQATSDANTSVVYTDDAYPYLTNVTPDDGLQFTLTDASATSSKSPITAAIKDTLATAGFSETKQDVSALSALKTTTYTNKGTVCQLIDYDGTFDLAEQSIVCADASTIDASYANAKTLLTKVDASVASLAKVVTQRIVTDGSKKLYDITVATTDTSKASEYYFATLDTNYEYLGDRNVGQIDDADSFKVSDQLKKSLADTKWGSFLTDNIKL